MGIVKIASREPAAKSDYSSCGDEDLTHEDRMLLQSFPDPESLGSERAEVDCELASSRGQMCNIPYGLYDLGDLTEVLSLETWNSCLVEDDRLRLAAYLPDMEQQDFVMTMKELFSGDVMFFGSPLRSFFLGLSGGLYSPEVSQPRELLMMLQRRRHYHFLKCYHDGMVGKFASMSNLLRSSDASASLGEKVPISRNRGVYEKRFPCVSLSSTTPPVTIKDEITTVSSPMKRAKLTDGPLSTHCSTRHNETAHVAKSAEMNSLESQTFRPLSDPRQNCSKLPKGVLKISTGCASVIDGSEGTHHRPRLVRAGQPGTQSSRFCTPPLVFAHEGQPGTQSSRFCTPPLVFAHEGQPGTQSSRFCTPPLVFAHDVHGFSENSSSHINRINGMSASSQRTPLHWEGTLQPYALMGKIPLGVQMTAPEEHSAVYPSMMLRGFYQPAANHSLAYSSEAYDTRECAHMKDLLKNFGGQNIVLHQSSPDPYARVRDDHQMNGYSTTHSLRNAESISEMLSLGTRMYPPHNNVSEPLETMRKHHDGMKLEPPPAKPVAEAEESRQFAYTYARRKPHKRSAMVEDTVLDGMANMKAKAIKL